LAASLVKPIGNEPLPQRFR